MRRRYHYQRYHRQRRQKFKHGLLAALRHIFVIKQHHLSLRRRVYMRVRSGLIFASLGWLGYHMLLGPPAISTGTAQLVPVTHVLPANQKLYPGLPKGVATALSSVVAIQRITGGNRGVTASGVIMNDSQVLTAGHVVDDGGRLSCRKTTVHVPGVLSPTTASSVPVTYGSLRHNASVDLAVLTVAADNNLRALPVAQLAQNSPRAGDSVYFVNFQPTAAGLLRAPTVSGHRNPVVFSGTVLGVTPEGLAVAAGSGFSYGLDEVTTVLRKGASGGAVFDSKGYLVGLSVSSDSLRADRSAADLAKTYGVSLPPAMYQVANIQQLDTGSITGIQVTQIPCP